MLHRCPAGTRSVVPFGTAPLRGHLRAFALRLDSDLAAIYGVTTKRLNEQAKRNAQRFPSDFSFRLTPGEAETAARSRSQIATLKRGQNIKFLPYAFTENGAVMAANILNSPQAVRMSVFVQFAAQWAPAPEPLRYAMGPSLAA